MWSANPNTALNVRLLNLAGSCFLVGAHLILVWKVVYMKSIQSRPVARRAPQRFTQLFALTIATIVLASFVVADVAASPNSAGPANLASPSGLNYNASLPVGTAGSQIGTSSIGSGVSKKFANKLAKKLTRIRRGPIHLKSTTTTAPRRTTTTFANGTKTTVFANGTTTTTFANGTTTTTLANGTTTTTFANGTTTTTVAKSTTTTTVAKTTTTTSPPPTTTTGSGSAIPDGVASNSEPSGQAPPGANAMNGYKLTYSTDFTGSALPGGWNAYSGAPGASDPGSQWATTHDVVSGGMLSLNAWQDPKFGNEWVTGGTSQDGVSRQYGAYFVRSRETGGGPTLVELLWPTNNSWPPEIDFNETQGLSTFTTATNIWAVSNGSKSQAESRLNIDMTQWNTFGVIWTPTSLTYTVNGKVWGTFTNASDIPATPMHLDLQQQTWCGSSVGLDGEINACPTSPQSMQIDWVAEYAAN